ncbi:MAG: hypothetical protein IT292_12225 [Deltaproteobacteria bacterium]|nr:hypothetical protein [Deltaproteobacteria bacterium]
MKNFLIYRSRLLQVLKFAFLASLFLIIFIACSKRYYDLPAYSSLPIYNPENNSVGRFKTSYLAEQIHAYFRGNIAGPLAVTTFVDIDNLQYSSSFGRILAEQIMSELVMKGYNVVEMRRSDSFQIQEGEGEFALSREIERLKQNYDISGIVVGTYVASPDRVYVNTRIIDPRTSMVVSVGSVEMSRTSEISKLLRSNSYPTSMERIPLQSKYEGIRKSELSEGHTSKNKLQDSKSSRTLKLPAPKLEPLS